MTAANPTMSHGGRFRKKRPRKGLPTRAAKANDAPRNANSWLALFIASMAARSSMPVWLACVKACMSLTLPPVTQINPTNAATAMKVSTMQVSITSWAMGFMVRKAWRMKLMGAV